MSELKNFFGTAAWEGDDFVIRLPLAGFIAGYEYAAEEQKLADMPVPRLIGRDAFKRLIEHLADDTYRHIGEQETGQTHLHDWADALIEKAQEDPDITEYGGTAQLKEGKDA